MFESDDDEQASLAARPLGQFEDPSVIPQLGAFLTSPGNEFCRSEAAHALGILGHEDAAPFLVAGLADDRPQVRQWSAHALAQIRLRDTQRAEVARALEAALQDGDDDTRGYAIQALGAVGLPESRVVLERCAMSDDSGVACDAAWSLARLSAPESRDTMRGMFDKHGGDVGMAVAAYLEQHGDDDDVSRALAIVDQGAPTGFRVLGACTPARALPPLLERLPETEGIARVYALGSAARLGHTQSADALFEMVGTLEGWAAIELVRIGDRRGLEATVEAAMSHYHDVTRAALEVLGAFGDAAVEPVLRKRFECADDEHRRVARTALERIGANP